LRIERNGKLYDTDRAKKIIERSVRDFPCRVNQALYRGHGGTLFKLTMVHGFWGGKGTVILHEFDEGEAREMIYNWGHNPSNYGLGESPLA
jgi:hypothetical protein